jgi:methyltransferase (TIGR00027 family)
MDRNPAAPATEPLVSNVSDTARWVACYRAIESARPDALFRDPLAERLDGDKGRAIVAHAPRQLRSGWPVIARTVAIDDMVRAALAEGCDGVVNLAAGLDTRPYRLDLPAGLPWIEADFPAFIAEKNELLAGETPRCALRRIGVDLADADARAAFLARAVDRHRRLLVISEGLLMYLDEPTVAALAHDLDRPGIAWWVFDTMSPMVREIFMSQMQGELCRSPMHFSSENGVAFFEALGWRVGEVRSAAQEALRLHRLPWLLALMMMLPFPQPDPRRLGRERWLGIVRLER